MNQHRFSPRTEENKPGLYRVAVCPIHLTSSTCPVRWRPLVLRPGNEKKRKRLLGKREKEKKTETYQTDGEVRRSSCYYPSRSHIARAGTRSRTSALSPSSSSLSRSFSCLPRISSSPGARVRARLSERCTTSAADSASLNASMNLVAARFWVRELFLFVLISPIFFFVVVLPPLSRSRFFSAKVPGCLTLSEEQISLSLHGQTDRVLNCRTGRRDL